MSEEAKRNPITQRFDLIPPEVLIAIADVLGKGAIKYGELNWQKSKLTGDKSPINHALKHIVNYQAKIKDDESDDLKIHLSHAIVNLMFEYWWETKTEIKTTKKKYSLIEEIEKLEAKEPLAQETSNPVLLEDSDIKLIIELLKKENYLFYRDYIHFDEGVAKMKIETNKNLIEKLTKMLNEYH